MFCAVSPTGANVALLQCESSHAIPLPQGSICLTAFLEWYQRHSDECVSLMKRVLMTSKPITHEMQQLLHYQECYSPGFHEYHSLKALSDQEGFFPPPLPVPCCIFPQTNSPVWGCTDICECQHTLLNENFYWLNTPQIVAFRICAKFMCYENLGQV